MARTARTSGLEKGAVLRARPGVVNIFEASLWATEAQVECAVNRREKYVAKLNRRSSERDLK